MNVAARQWQLSFVAQTSQILGVNNKLRKQLDRTVFTEASDYFSLLFAATIHPCKLNGDWTTVAVKRAKFPLL